MLRWDGESGETVVKLNNGAKVIAMAKVTRVGNRDSTVVLAEYNGEEVCWVVDAEGNAFWGYYGDFAKWSYIYRLQTWCGFPDLNIKEPVPA